MTGLDIYKMASSFLYEKDNDDAESKEFSIPFLNTLLMEALPYENSIRAFNGDPVLTTAPLLTDLNTDIDYDDALTRIALPYGLASLYFAENLDNYRSNLYRAQFISALNDAAKLSVTTVEDVYIMEGENG